MGKREREKVRERNRTKENCGGNVCCSCGLRHHDVCEQSVNKQNAHNKGEQITSSRDASKSKMLVDRSSRSKQDREEELVMHISGK